SGSDERPPEPAKPVREEVALLSTEEPRRKSNNVPPPESGEQLMVKEAYKLFEGPGSRQIG
ncbi:MAG TPA: hypothetical protein PKN86_18620, partial [Candidatus Obscuribacter sp.]|nr:hypothetical protein [Candidatus Obscuribacter sp.]